jgi:hypothetical protein
MAGTCFSKIRGLEPLVGLPDCEVNVLLATLKV